MSFFEVEFPTQVAFGAVGGPTWSTTINTGFSGYEQRNRNWTYPLAKYQISLDHKPIASFTIVNEFFLNVAGKADAFRFSDLKDYAATAQVIGTGDGANKVFQLVKNYTIGGRTFTRPIKKPITSEVKDYQGTSLTDTVKVYDNGVEKTHGAGYPVGSPPYAYSLDETTGIITFLTAPLNGHIITADFEFHVPVRFDTDEMKAVVEESDAEGGNALITWSSVDMIEVRL
jgi:uncharacterized protein (TIGR02217 family)